MGRAQRGLTWSIAGLLALAVGCSDDATSPSNTSGKGTTSSPSKPASEAPRPAPVAKKPAVVVAETRSQAEMIEAGRGVYNGNCIACHSPNPALDGALGPAVAGASAELIEARVLRAEYPEGYTPKRDTRVMVALPHLEPKLSELAAYLGSLDPS